MSQFSKMPPFSFARFVILSAALLAAAILPASLHAATPEEQAVIAPLQALFDGMAHHDREAVREQLVPGGMVSLKRGEQVIQMHFDVFVEHIGSAHDPIEERIHDPLVRIDNDLAVIWAPYEFLLDGKVQHCGTDIANLVRRNGRWLISGIADNSRDTCGK